MRKLLWKVNEPRKKAGLPKVPFECLRLKRMSVRPFERPEGSVLPRELGREDLPIAASSEVAA
jgi:hypothetical protein